MKKINFLIVGSAGLLGSAICKVLKKKKIKFFTSSKKNSNFNLNLISYKKIENFFLNHKIDILINCAAITNIDYCERNYSLVKKINYDFPIYLSNLSKKYNFKMVFISTDQVYKDNKNTFLKSENSKLKGINLYSRFKVLAEKKIKNNRNILIVRTNFTGKSKKKNSFSDWVYYSIINKKKIRLFYDMFVSTIDVISCAKIIIKLSISNLTGVYNLGIKKPISKKIFAIEFAKKLKKNIIYTNSSVETLKVLRPKNLGLNVKKIENKLNIKMPDYKKTINNLAIQYNK